MSLMSRAIGMLVVFIALNGVWMLVREHPLAFWLVQQLTVSPTTWLINLLTPEVGAQMVGHSIKAAGGGINVLYGCEGADLLMLTSSALLATHLSWRHKLQAWLILAPVVWLINVARLTALFYANRFDKDWFAALHGTVGPLVIVLLIGSLFLMIVWRFERTRV